MRFIPKLFVIVLFILNGCSLTTVDDNQSDRFFLRKKYHISKIYEVSDDGSIGESFVLPGEYNFDKSNTYLDFYYGGLDYYRENGSKFIVSASFIGPSDKYDIEYLNMMNKIEPTIGDYLFSSKRGYSAPFYLKFNNDYKHLCQQDFNNDNHMYRAIGFPEYYVRLNFLLFLEEGIEPKKVCLEFGTITKVNDLDSTPSL